MAGEGAAAGGVRALAGVCLCLEFLNLLAGALLTVQILYCNGTAAEIKEQSQIAKAVVTIGLMLWPVVVVFKGYVTLAAFAHCIVAAAACSARRTSSKKRFLSHCSKMYVLFVATKVLELVLAASALSGMHKVLVLEKATVITQGLIIALLTVTYKALHVKLSCFILALDADAGPCITQYSPLDDLESRSFPLPSSTGERCLMCLEEMSASEVVSKLACSHLFHRACIEPWLQRSATCPLRCDLACKAEKAERKRSDAIGSWQASNPLNSKMSAEELAEAWATTGFSETTASHGPGSKAPIRPRPGATQASTGQHCGQVATFAVADDLTSDSEICL